ncbi:MAG TPA: L-lysine 6-transaminase [Candidatus Kapabacteria bacterium]|nr:L-lysine 6-transaminase [Candidatus Kapabacteria bacterium]
MNSLTDIHYSANYVESKEVHNTLSKHMLADGYDFVLDLEKSKGSILHDSKNNKDFIDFFSFFASMPIGMNHPKMYNNKIINALGKIAVNKPSNSDIYTSEMATFVKTLFNLAIPNYFSKAFFISGGALAVENALKTAFDWKIRKNFRKGYTYEKGTKIIHFQQAFHGRSGYTMSLTNTDINKVKYFPKFDWPRISNPKIKFPLDNESLASVIDAENLAVAQIKQSFIEHRDDIAAIIIEPIQGEGGDNHFRKEFHQELRKLADENEALLIYDEIQTGVGMTGKWWAHQHYDMAPDIICFGKKMQVCGIAVNDRIEDVPDNVFHLSSRINSTWGGNLVDMVRSTMYLEIIAEENLVENAANMGLYLLKKMNEIESEYPEFISNIRGKGLFAAFDLPDGNLRKKFISDCYQNGLMILACGERSVRFRPALDINQETIDKGFDIIKQSLIK